ncbi:MAG: leucine--tRNA ligase [Nitrososphaerota archaeon]
MDEKVARWVRRWEDSKAFEANPDPSRQKLFVTFPFPYMNGPLHLGHVFSATRIDVYARFKRMQGYNVLYPWAWHWTGQPVVSAAQRLREGDERQRRTFIEMDKVPEEEVDRFTDPVYLANYYTRLNKETVKHLGLSIDWRREFHTTSYEPLFSKFVEWQYRKLRELGYVIQGTHPVVWCPKDKSPTQDHDRLEGEGVSPEEYTLVKFRLEDDNAFLVAATFRPETIPGATNLWVKEDADYVEALVDGERWIIVYNSVQKLQEQLHTVSIAKKVKGKELIGKFCIAPITGKRIPVLPALFVDPNVGTGVVYSVPAHAPYDWLALRDMQKSNGKLKELATSIRPISIIHTEGFGEYPAVEIVDRLQAKDQLDGKGDLATKEVYTKEFNYGRMKDNCGAYSGLSVKDAKQKIIADLKASGEGSSFFDLADIVICRCGTRCIVKTLQGQWFLKYSDQLWKDRSIEAIKKAKIMPDEARNWFIETVRWLKEWPCARKTGLGTPLPWDSEWLVETLSDSTVYMAFYTIDYILREAGVKAEWLTDELFDYIFYGSGDASIISSHVNESLLRRMRQEFLYWYPVDLRNSGKDLVANHLTFFIMQHVALFPPEHWPRAIGVNGMVQLEGARMSKSHGNFITAREAIDTYGSDATRATLILSAEGMDDPDWRAKNAFDMKDKLHALPELMNNLLGTSKERDETMIDRWLMSRLQQRIKTTTEALEQLRTKTAFYNSFFAVWNDLKWYIRREEPNLEVLKKFFDVWIRLLAPFVPFTAEEMYEALGKKELVSLAEWPRYEASLMDDTSELSEYLVQSVIEDIRKIKEVLKQPASSADIYVINSEIFQLATAIYSSLSKGKRDSEIIKEAIAASKDKQNTARLVQSIIKYCREQGSEFIGRVIAVRIDELSTLTNARDFISSETGLKSLSIHVYDGTKLSREKIPYPMKPAILLH